MQSLRLNPILNTDSYKLTHWWQYPPDTRHIYSYVESRGGMFDETMLAMLQYILKSNFAGQVFTLDDVEEARRVAAAHFSGRAKTFSPIGPKPFSSKSGTPSPSPRSPAPSSKSLAKPWSAPAILRFSPSSSTISDSAVSPPRNLPPSAAPRTF